MIYRKQKIDELKQFINKNIIKVVTGFRRSGKSTLFLMFIDYLKKNVTADNHIIYINLEDPIYDFNNYKDLYNFIINKIIDNKKYYVFIDEIQNILNFEKILNGLFIKNNVDLYITGSNAKLLSGELATLISGRYVEINMLPYSFNEFLDAYNKKISKKEIFDIFITNGGMPGNVEYIDDGFSYKYLDGVFSTVVYKDIMQRTNIYDKILMESIIKYMMSTIGSFTNIKSISDTLTSNNYKTTNHTVERYVSSFLESFLFYKVEAFNIDGKQFLKRNYKYYIIDTGFINYLLGKTANKNYGHIIENIVYLELRRRYREIYIGKISNLEIDFVVKDFNNNIEYFQVSMKTDEKVVLDRELKPLKKIDNNYKKTLLTMDEIPETDFDGIIRKNIIEWLNE